MYWTLCIQGLTFNAKLFAQAFKKCSFVSICVHIGYTTTESDYRILDWIKYTEVKTITKCHPSNRFQMVMTSYGCSKECA